MFVIDVAGGDDIPRKRGPGVLQCDLLVINKVDLAPYVGVDASRILDEARMIRDQRPTISCQCRGEDVGHGLDAILKEICDNVLFRAVAGAE